MSSLINIPIKSNNSEPNIFKLQLKANSSAFIIKDSMTSIINLLTSKIQIPFADGNFKDPKPNDS